jgi:hypothetical protein
VLKAVGKLSPEIAIPVDVDDVSGVATRRVVAGVKVDVALSVAEVIADSTA